MINLSRQREQTLTFVVQEAHHTDKNIASSAADIIIFQDPVIFQPEFERSKLREIAEETKKIFAAINVKDRSRWAYIYSPGDDFTGITNQKSDILNGGRVGLYLP
jgi:hypothetical protein